MRRDAADFPVVLDRDGGASLPVQLAGAVRSAVAAGVLAPGTAVPSTRALATRLGVSRGTVEAAYDQLAAEGYLVARPRAGTVIAPGVAAPQEGRPTPRRGPGGGPGRTAATRGAAATRGPSATDGTSGTATAGGPLRAVRPSASTTSAGADSPTPGSGELLDLVPGHEATSPLGDAAWRSAWRRASSPTDRPGRPDPAGVAALRLAIAEHLRLMRGMAVSADQVVVTAGAREGLGLLLAALFPDPDRRTRVAVEDPGFPGLRRFLARQPVTTVPFAADRLPDDAAGCDLVIVTPNYQYPDGRSMDAAARGRVLSWALRTATLILEDDYDSESRYLGPPLPTLFGLGGETPVVQLGTFSSVLSHDIGTGYLLLPPDLVDPVVATRADLGSPVAAVTQRAVAAYLADGGLRRRIHRNRRRLTVTRDVVAAHLSGLPGAIDGGRLLVLPMAEPAATTVRDRCRARGVRLGDLAQGWAGTAHRTGLIIDYGGVEAGDLDRALDLLVGLLGGPGGGLV